MQIWNFLSKPQVDFPPNLVHYLYIAFSVEKARIQFIFASIVPRPNFNTEAKPLKFVHVAFYQIVRRINLE